MLYLMDADTVARLVAKPKQPDSVRAAHRLSAVGTSQVCTSAIVEAELRFGAEKRGSKRLSAQLTTVLDALEIHAWESSAAVRCATIRTRLERRGQIIGGNDLLIAAHAMALGCTCYGQRPRVLASRGAPYRELVGMRS